MLLQRKQCQHFRGPPVASVTKCRIAITDLCHCLWQFTRPLFDNGLLFLLFPTYDFIFNLSAEVLAQSHISLNLSLWTNNSGGQKPLLLVNSKIWSVTKITKARVPRTDIIFVSTLGTTRLRTLEWMPITTHEYSRRQTYLLGSIGRMAFRKRSLDSWISHLRSGA